MIRVMPLTSFTQHLDANDVDIVPHVEASVYSVSQRWFSMMETFIYCRGMAGACPLLGQMRKHTQLIMSSERHQPDLLGSGEFR